MHCILLAPNCYPNSSVSAHLEAAKLLFTRQDVFLANMPSDYLLAKLDFSSAFNNIYRVAMLSAVAEHVPSIYQFCLSSYEKTTLLKFSSNIILPQEGCQQGDPLGPLLFCLAIHPLIVSCNSSLKMAFMDDVTLGGPAATVASDVAMIKAERASRGLF